MALQQNWEGLAKLSGICLVHFNQNSSESGASCQTDDFCSTKSLVTIPGTAQEKSALQLPLLQESQGGSGQLRLPKAFAFIQQRLLLFLQ